MSENFELTTVVPSGDFNIGDRVELHPALDLWMRGARYGTVIGVTEDGRVIVQLDHPQVRHPVQVRPTDLTIVAQFTVDNGLKP